MMRSLASFLVMLQLLMEVSCPTFTTFSFQRRPAPLRPLLMMTVKIEAIYFRSCDSP
ncbi:hypothetical protein OIU77_015360 [Salix suchowensis]|uniref:Uncharacterized protein n=1 Tax=Salix suchowensis TaxID=1278906 RepID=A0ABQ8ZGP6_9ROSI|nr:hypothetical protein OIU77_015360 [Salix suchowensis]